MSQASDLITKFRDATDAAAARTKTLFDAMTARLNASAAPITPEETAEADAIVATLNAMGRDQANPLPPPVVA